MMRAYDLSQSGRPRRPPPVGVNPARDAQRQAGERREPAFIDAAQRAAEGLMELCGPLFWATIIVMFAIAELRL
jgi:hypothetical protein